MKTLDDAMEIMIRRNSGDDDSDTKIMMEAQEKYASIHEEIQTNEKSYVIADLILAIGVANDLEPHQLIVIALSQGVCIGIEMEKAE